MQPVPAAEVYHVQQPQTFPAHVLAYFELCYKGLQQDAKNHPEHADLIMEVEEQIRGVMAGRRDPKTVNLTKLIVALGHSANGKNNLELSEFVDKPQNPLDPNFKPFKTDSLLAARDEILAKAKGRTLVLWDIDYVVFRSETHFGSVEWAKEIYADIEKVGFTSTASEDILNVIWRYIQPETPIELCDDSLPDVVASLHAQGNIVQYGMTARPPEDAAYTLQQLESLNFAVPQKHQKSAHRLPSASLQGVHLPMCVLNGIAFVNSYTSKGVAANQLNLADYDTVVMLDDSSSNVNKVAIAALSAGKEYIGIHYTGAMAKQKYEPLIARVQTEHYPQRLSNEEAHNRLAAIH